MVKVLYFLLFHSNKKGMELVPWVDPDALLRTKVVPDQEVCLSVQHFTLHVKICTFSCETFSWDEGHKTTTQLWVACTTTRLSA